ncbi:50S ribosomal protein L11 methyltransferase [Kushneria aurantia]|uniref:Ribosomal protein L11 methyltransferase n=1 Tax=Kushneria aurantia TaxID=504092 RepID=A0ABV6G8F6_9GAMM|nr:50S ribosomal protein L11 methyltransferase [Kushneria aurantia]
MAWLQLRAHIAPQHADLLETLLTDEGAQAITLEDAVDDPVFEPERGTTPLWQQTVLTGLYDDLEGVEAMIDRVRAQWASHAIDEPCPQIDWEVLQDRDWSREWMDGFEPLQMGERLWIVPSWHEAPQPDAVNLLLDPGLAFGTGTHPTTALCLGWLDEQALAGHLRDTTVLDVGCGSGILAIAALALGAGYALGTDIDPQALQASRDNAERNAIEEHRLLLAPAEPAPSGRFDIVLANILAAPLIELSSMIAARVAPGGRIALSGVLAQQAEEVIDAYRHCGLHIDEPREREGWVCITGTRPA